jgi:hypothetical protein
MLNGTEKSMKQFEEITDRAGLEIINIWPFSFGAHASIECRLESI